MKSDTKSAMKLIIGVGIVMLSYLAAFLLTPYAWSLYKEYKGLTPGSIGTRALEDTPRVHSIHEMEQHDRFAISEGEPSSTDFFTIDSGFYAVLTLESGERVAARLFVDDSPQSDETVPRWYARIGSWRPWELTEIERAILLRKELSLTTMDFYVDMKGNLDTAVSQDKFVSGFQFFAIWFFIGACVLIWRSIVLVQRHGWESNRPKNDTERWIAGTHALWGISFARALDTRHKKKDVIRIGGAPKSPDAQQRMRVVLIDQWDISSYGELLDTVAYMSEGEGFYRCATQSTRAWQLCRSTALLGMAYVAGWADRADIIERSHRICRIIQDTFSSWDELYVSFLEHYAQWRLDADDMSPAAQTDVQQRVDIYWALKRKKDSPCHLPWNLKLEP